MAMSRKEMGLAVRAIAQYASDCCGNADYLEMVKAFEIALDTAYVYELREEDWIAGIYSEYLSEAVKELEYEIARGKNAQDILNELNKT